MSERAIASHLDISQGGVRNVIQKWKKFGELEDLPRAGRPRAISAGMMGQVRLQLKRGRLHTTADVRRYLSERYGLHVSSHTTTRALKRGGNTLYHQCWRPALTASQRKMRVDAARAWKQKMALADWQRIVFTDEAPIRRVDTNSTRLQWLPRDEDFRDRRTRGRPPGGSMKITVWAAIGPTGVLAHQLLKDNLTARIYCDLLQAHLPARIAPHFRRRRFFFQQDNAPQHKAKATMALLSQLSKKHRFEILPWPPCSPDLSPIENFWSELKRHLDGVAREQGDPKDMGELEERIVDALALYSGEEKRGFFTHLYDSLPRRMDQVIKTRGKPLEY